MSLDKYKHLRLGVGVISNGMWNAEFGICLVNLMTALNRFAVPGYGKTSVHLIHTKGSILPKSRMETVKIAQDAKCTHLLWLDTDQTFPRNVAHRLIASEAEVIGANIPVKMIPSTPTARGKPTSNAPLGEIIYTDHDSTGHEKVWRIGTGILMMNMKVFERTGVNIFEMKWNEEAQTFQGEDWSMCTALENAGFDIWIDHDLSKECGHIGYFEYTHDVVGVIMRESEDGQGNESSIIVPA